MNQSIAHPKGQIMPRIPQPKKIPHTLKVHGETRIDPYFWMRCDTRDDPEVLAHLEAENTYQKAMLGHTEALQKQLFGELKARVQHDDESVPYKKSGYEYWQRYQAELEHPIYLYKPPTKKEQILFDPNLYSAGEDYYDALEPVMSHDQSRFAVAEDRAGRNLFQIRFYDLSSQTFLKDTLMNTSGDLVWLPDNQAVLYNAKNEVTLLDDKVYVHRLGTDQSEDILIYEEHDKSYYTYLQQSKFNQEIHIIHTSTESTYASLVAPDGCQVKPLLPQDPELKHYMICQGDRYYILTNWQAINYRIMEAQRETIHDLATWREVVPHRSDTLVEDFELFSDHLVYIERAHGHQKMIIHTLSRVQTQEVLFDDVVFSIELGRNLAQQSDDVRLIYSSLTTPTTVYDVNLVTGQRQQRKQAFAGTDFKSSDYKTERLAIEARDGTQVPVTLVYHQDHFTHQGTQPLYIYGYGAYGVTIMPDFHMPYLNLLNRGFVVAIAHVRGSQMLGRDWYYQGRQHHKKNSFNDFVDATKGLIEQKYGDPLRVFAQGGSAGGLLMGAVVNQAPHLYLGVLADVPFVDIVTTMLDQDLPLTTNEYDEWGNPNRREDYEYMLSYSPYDQIKKQAYPAMLIKTGFHDSQVQYFEPAKWVAKLRDHQTSEAPILFQVNMHAGHSGDAGRFEYLKEVALEQAFILDLAFKDEG
tara:strand:+ start:6305 stop:8389 length:2085 start_codon:yes stop_codon:yes gene_type:complete